MAIRQFLDLKKKCGSQKYYLSRNVVHALAKCEKNAIWFPDKPCPFSKLRDLYLDVCKGYGKGNADLDKDVAELWQKGLKDWLRDSGVFRISSVGGEDSVYFAPQAKDVIVDCWDGDGKDIPFEELTPRWEWNRCDDCGKLNNDSLLKYEILCSATVERVRVWCKFFKHDYSLTERNLSAHLQDNCRCCPCIDCPYAWKCSDKNGGGRGEVGEVSFALPTSALRRYAKIDFDSYKSDLSKKIEPEDWGYGFKCLQNYLDMTFYTQYTASVKSGRNGLSEAERFSWFNTGLLTDKKLEDVFMCFKKDGDGFVFDGITWKDNPNKYFDKYSKETGSVPKYIPIYEDIKDLYWDENLKFVWDDNFDHIFFENQDRILNCRSFVNGTSGVDVPETAKVNTKKFCEELKKMMKKGPEHKVEREKYKQTPYYKSVRKLFDHSVFQMRKLMVRNFKWVLPFYYPLNRSMSIGIPIFLNPTGTGDIPDVVLVCNKRHTHDGGVFYDVRTMLDNDQIYTDARQVCKPYCEWLSELLKLQRHPAPREIRTSVHELADQPEDDIATRFDRRFGDESRAKVLAGVVSSCPYRSDFGWIRPEFGQRCIRFDKADVKPGCEVKVGDKVHYEKRKRGCFINAINVARYV